MPTDTNPALLHWQIWHPRASAPVPSGILTFAPGGADLGLPPEVAVHLPTAAGNQVLLDALSQPAGHPRTTAIKDKAVRDKAAGLFMADCFLHVERTAEILRAAGIEWVCNLPTVGQHDRAFQHVLSQVNMGVDRELAVCDAFRARGFRLLIAVSGAEEAALWVSLNPEAIAHVPALAAFHTGRPALSQRRAAEADLRAALAAKGWNGLFLPYGDPAESTAMGDQAAPCLCPPRAWPT
ncbi:hypothetical protein [Stappia indica]|uniref:hypothetical protein n=1 Tax=Stappia indica TaxID=538381 RepID=UPI001CD7D855|nr:hypothetical protein [Stappia indica]MCA1296739.1 hypothetical protein [Stappia indica]